MCLVLRCIFSTTLPVMELTSASISSRVGSPVSRGRDNSLALSMLYRPPGFSALGLRGEACNCGWAVNLTGEGLVSTVGSQADSNSALSEAIVLIRVDREERLGIPKPRESRLDRAEDGTSANKESLLSDGSGNRKGEDSLVGEVIHLVGEAGPGDLKLRLLI